jgi:hypothetical protein
MTKSEQAEPFEKILSTSLQRVVDFLKYSEAKNAALLTISSAWIVASLSLLVGDKALPRGIEAGFILAVLFFAGSAALAMISFFPQINLSWFIDRQLGKYRAKNLIYFGDIATMSTSNFEDAARKRYWPHEEQFVRDEYLYDLSVQIAVNSQIANNKLRLFRYGLYSLTLGATILFFPLLHWALNRLWGA